MNKYTLLEYKRKWYKKEGFQQEVDNLGKELRRIRLAFNLSQYKVANMLNMGQNTISAIEQANWQEHGSASVGTAWRINEFCEVIHRLKMNDKFKNLNPQHKEAFKLIKQEVSKLRLDF